MVLEADSIIFKVGDRDILRGAFIKCELGEVVGVLGRNGSGKSVLFEIIFGTLKANNSFVRIDERVLTGKAYRSGLITFMPQFDYLPRHLKVKTILWTAAIPREIYMSDEVINRICNHRVNELSGGELRYLELFVALHSRPPFIILDEPFTGMSPIVVEKMQKAIRGASKNHGIIISDHKYRVLCSLADRLLYLEDGRTRYIEDIPELKGKYYMDSEMEVSLSPVMEREESGA